MVEQPQVESIFPAPDGQRITIRHCAGFGELDQCVALQVATWGYGDLDVVPRRVFLLAQVIGGQAIGAFTERGTLAGFAMALPALDAAGAAYLHSHMLAVVPELRNSGLGRALKVTQRADAIARGLTHMEWTFDPLEVKNAYLNIHKLGSIVRRLSPNFYGVSSSRLQAGLPTDRLHADWHLVSPRVCAALGNQTGSTLPVLDTVVVPAAAASWKQNSGDAELADRLRNLQAELREHFLHAFASGLVVAGFRRGEDGAGVYELAAADAARAESGESHTPGNRHSLIREAIRSSLLVADSPST